MKTLVMLFTLAVALSAQWPPHATSGVPKTASGQPNLNAPAPRATDGKPDLSGIWENFRPGDGAEATSNGGSIGLGPLRSLSSSQFWNIGYGIKDGLPFQPWAKDLLAKRMSENSKDNPDAHCLPMGLMQLHTHPQPRKIIQAPGVIVILYEANGGIRQIFTDGRSLPRGDAQPWWYGYSIGKWDGDTLVVETTGFRDDGWLDVNGSPLTEAATMTERFRRVNYGNLEMEITVDDPKAYTKPWTAKVTQRIMLDTELIEFVCAENEKSVPHLVGK
jgi:hypothetical protein